MWWLFRDNLLPTGTIFYGYARTKLSISELRAKCDPYMQVKPNEQAKYEEFWRLNYYFAGSYESRRDFELLNQEIIKFENVPHANRLFYLALPPSVFESVTELIKATCMGDK